MIKRSKSIIVTFFMAIFLAIIIGYTNSAIIAKYPIVKDAKEYTTAAYHLKTKGVISDDGIKPSLFREPFTIAILALHMHWLTDIPNNIHDIKDLTNSPYYVQQINQVNLHYIICAFLILWALAYRLTSSHLYSAIVIYISWSSFYIQSWYLYRPLTEYAASVFILLICYLGIITYDQTNQFKRGTYSLMLGISIGLLALTKSVALYVGLVFIPIYILTIYVCKKNHIKYLASTALTLLLGFSLIVLPWMYRNAQLSDGATISGRGGPILLGRSKLNQTISKDLLGGIYVYSPPKIQNNVFEKLLGFKSQSLWEGGKYASLNRNVAFRNNPNNTAVSKFDDKKDSTSYKKGFKEINNNIWSHITTTGVLAWRGLWSFDGGNHLRPSGDTVFSIGSNLVCFFSLLLLPIVSLLSKRVEWFLLTLFPVGFFWIYALFSHFIPRYSAPLIPVAILAFIVVTQQFLNYLRHQTFFKILNR